MVPGDDVTIYILFAFSVCILNAVLLHIPQVGKPGHTEFKNKIALQYLNRYVYLCTGPVNIGVSVSCH